MRILILPDLHAPWIDWKAVNAAYEWKKKNKPDLVIQLGDLTDQKIWSRWQSSPDDYNPSKEFKEAEKALKKLHKMFPKMVILRGNHDERIKNRAVEGGIPSRMFKDVNEVFNYKGWTWVSREKKYLIKCGKQKILFCHGDEMGGTVAQKSRILGHSVVQGHTHKASITYTKNLNGHFFAFEVGCLMDVKSKAASYAAANPVGCSIGFGVIENGIPTFIPC